MDYKSLLPFSGGRIGSRVGAYDDRFGSLVRELNLLFDEFQRTDRAASRGGTGRPPGGSLDVRDTDTAYEICLGLPEFDEGGVDVLLGDVHSLKEKRSMVRPIVAELQRRFSVSAAETGWLDLHRRAGIGVAVVAADRAHVVEVLDAAERIVAGRPEIELLSVRRDLRRSDD